MTPHDYPHTLTNDITAVGTTLGAAFHPLPVNKYFSNNPSPEESTQNFIKTATRFINGGGHVIESADHEAVALWISPNFQLPPSSEPASERFQEFLDKSNKMLKEHVVLTEKGYWYLSLLARNPQSTTKGVVGNVVKPILKRAKDEGVPVVLEAASAYSRDVYEHWGFVNYGEIVLGKGVVNKHGDEDVEGEGVTLYFMVYNNGDKTAI